jgi:hypothetical protein
MVFSIFPDKASYFAASQQILPSPAVVDIRKPNKRKPIDDVPWRD